MSRPQVKWLGESGATVNGKFVEWDLLRQAAQQADRALAASYQEVLDEARDQALAVSPIVVSYGHDTTNVWYTVSVWTLWGEFGVPRQLHGLTLVAADEGGTLPNGMLAEREARAVAERIRKIWPNRDVRVREGHS